MLRRWLGDGAFYKKLILLTLPIMVQNGISNFVNMLDNIMIGAVGTAQMTGVAITNQLIFIFNLCVFGAVSGAGIFGAQFFGNRDYQGVRHSFRFKLIFSGIVTALWIALFLLLGESMLGLYMQGEQNITDPVATMQSATSYMRIMLLGLVPFTLVQCYSSTLREGASPTLPMIAGVVAVVVNLIGNYILIFGKFGAPRMEANGAAVATVISRYVELAVVTVGTHANRKKYGYMAGVYKSLHVPRQLVGKLLVKGLPLMMNEALWASGIAVVNQCYSVRGLDAVAAGNISQTFWNVFSISFLAVGSAIAIVAGQMLGANQLKEAKSAGYRMIGFSFSVAVVTGVLYFICAGFIPMAYNTEQEIREMATGMMRIAAIVMPFDAVAHASYFVMRSGGKMMVTFAFDSGMMWLFNVPLAFVLINYTSMPFLWVFAVIQSLVVLKMVAGLLLVRSGFWIKNIVKQSDM